MKVKKMMSGKYLLKNFQETEKGQKGSTGQWPKHFPDNLFDISWIMTNTRKNCYGKMSKMLKMVITTLKLLRS